MEGFEDIYKKYYIQIYRFLYRLSGNRDISDELTQQTLYKGFMHFDKFERRSSIYSWLCQIAKNEWYSECKRLKRYVCEEDNRNAEDNNNTEAEAVDRVMLEVMRREIATLSEPYRDVIILHTYAELPFTDIAKQYGKSESWARVTYYRGKEF